jgi:hypothetical protein
MVAVNVTHLAERKATAKSTQAAGAARELQPVPRQEKWRPVTRMAIVPRRFGFAANLETPLLRRPVLPDPPLGKFHLGAAQCLQLG